MKFWKKADAEIRVRVYRNGGEMENKVETMGSTVELWSAFEAICRGLLETAQKQGGKTDAAVFADVMETTLRRSIETTGVKSLEEILKDMLGTGEEENGDIMAD